MLQNGVLYGTGPLLQRHAVLLAMVHECHYVRRPSAMGLDQQALHLAMVHECQYVRAHVARCL